MDGAFEISQDVSNSFTDIGFINKKSLIVII